MSRPKQTPAMARVFSPAGNDFGAGSERKVYPPPESSTIFASIYMFPSVSLLRGGRAGSPDTIQFEFEFEAEGRKSPVLGNRPGKSFIFSLFQNHFNRQFSAHTLGDAVSAVVVAVACCFLFVVLEVVSVAVLEGSKLGAF